MRIAVASGKGGTGKTTVATNLAVLLDEMGEKTRYIDCDVEEPNGHLFLKPDISETEMASIPVPRIDESVCDACGECVRFCEYKALARLGRVVMVFPELCHGCGGCTLVCPNHAVTEHPREIGAVEAGSCGVIRFVHGRLNVGEAMSPPLIRAVLAHAGNDAINIIDAPPGTSCPVIASIRNADYVLLVSEPTPFGLNDLGLALDMVRELGVACGVVINRADAGAGDARAFCGKRNADIIAELPDDRRVAEAYSRGGAIVRDVPGMRERFADLWHAVRERVNV